MGGGEDAKASVHNRSLLLFLLSLACILLPFLSSLSLAFGGEKRAKEEKRVKKRRPDPLGGKGEEERG